MATYVPVLILMGLAMLVGGGMFAATTVFGPKAPNPSKTNRSSAATRPTARASCARA